MGYFITVVGLICFLEGLPYLASPTQLKRLMAQISCMPDRPMRLLGAVLMIVGLLCVYWGRNHGG